MQKVEKLFKWCRAPHSERQMEYRLVKMLMTLARMTQKKGE